MFINVINLQLVKEERIHFKTKIVIEINANKKLSSYLLIDFNNYFIYYIFFADTHDVNGLPIITIETRILSESGLNCYEIATLILYYNTIPTT